MRPPNYDEVVQTVRQWPRGAQANLAQVIIHELSQEARGEQLDTTHPKIEPRDRGAILEWIRTRPDTGLPPPTDEEVAQWIDEYRMEKYG